MNVKIKSITGFNEAFTSMFISKRTWNSALDLEIERVCDSVLDSHGRIRDYADEKDLEQFNKWLKTLLKMGQRHITVLRFVDITIMTEGLHRAGQDDVDAHARRFDNRIIRNSTRLAEFSDDEMSEWYKDKILTTDQMLSKLNISIPSTVKMKDGEIYIKAPNGYVKKEYADNKDVKRGLYMLSIPSNFVSKINLCEWGHVYQERNEKGGANPEVKMWAEMVMKEITKMFPQITKEFVLAIKN